MVLEESDTKYEYGTFYPGNVTPDFVIHFLVSSTIGVFLSAAAFILLILTAIRFPEWRSVYKNLLLIQFMLARILYIGVRYIYDIRNVYKLCTLDCNIVLNKFLLISSEMSVVCWMFVFTMHMHDSLVKVFGIEEKNIWRTTLWTWGLPLLISSLLTLSFYIQNDKDLLYILIYFLLVKWPVLAFNAVLLISILKSILTNNQCAENNKKITITIVMLISMFSLQQFVADIYKLVYIELMDNYGTYIIVIGSNVLIYQCALSILFWVFGNSNTRKLWSNPKIRPQSQMMNRNSSV